MAKIKSDLRKEYRLQVFAPIGFHVNKKDKKKIVKTRTLTISKIRSRTFVRANETKIQEKFEKFKGSLMESRVLKFLLP